MIVIEEGPFPIPGAGADDEAAIQRLLRNADLPAAAWSGGRLIAANEAYLTLAGGVDRGELVRGDAADALIAGDGVRLRKVFDFTSASAVRVHRANLSRSDGGGWSGLVVDFELDAGLVLSLLMESAAPAGADLPVGDIPEMFFTAGPAGGIDYVSPALHDFIGGGGTSQAGKAPWADAIHPDDQHRVVSTWRGCLRTGEVFEIDYRLRRRDGQYRWIRTRSRPVRRRDGEAGWFGAFLDIHDLKSAQILLGESERRFQAMCDNAPCAVRVIDGERRAVYVNRGWCDLTGVEPEAALGHDWFARIHAEDLGAVQARFAEAAARREALRIEYRVVGRDGRHRRVLDAAAPRLGPDDLFLGHVSIISDLSAQAVRPPLAAAEPAAAAGDAASKPMIVLDPQGVVVSANAAAAHLLDCGPGEAEGRVIDDLAPSLALRSHIAALGREPALGRSLTRTLTAIQADGARTPYELSLTGVELGQLRLFVGVFHDLSAQQRGERRLHELERDLAHMARLGATAEMAPAIAQEVNQPLAAAANYAFAAETLLESGDADGPAKARALIHQVTDQVLRAGQLVRRLRDFSANDQGGMRREELGGVIEEAAALAQAGLGRAGLQFQTPNRARGPAWALIDRVQIQQVILNLARNAVEAADGDLRRRLRIGLEAAPEGWIITVDGEGLDPPSEHPAGSPPQPSDPPGGVAFGGSRMIVEAHGGRVWAQASEGRAARFRVSLPAAPEENVGVG